MVIAHLVHTPMYTPPLPHIQDIMAQNQLITPNFAECFCSRLKVFNEPPFSVRAFDWTG